MTLPLVDRVRRLPPASRAELYELLARTPGALSDVRNDWEGVWARDDQIVDPAVLLLRPLVIFTGPRGVGKTRAAVQLWLREIREGRATRPRIFAATEADVDKAVVHGESGVMTCLARADRPKWIADEGPAGVLRFPNGIEAVCFTARAPEGAVSHQGDLDLYDDIAKWGPHAATAWSHAQLSCRVGYGVGIVATTRRGTHLLRRLLGGTLDGVEIRRPEDIRANRNNLTAAYFRRAAAVVDGDLARQELDDEDASAASPFAGVNFDKAPVRVEQAGELEETIVAADPADGKGGDHDLWGIGAAALRVDEHVVVLEDVSGSYDDAEAGAEILDLCDRRGALKIIVEGNRGKERVLTVIRAAHYKRELDRRRADPKARPRALPEIIIVIAKEGKKLRAGPVRTLYIDGLIHHVAGLELLERQQREWDPTGPRRPRVDDRIDWLVHAVHHLADLPAKEDIDPREAFRGFAKAQEHMPAPTFGGPAGAATTGRRRERGERLV